MSLLDYLTRRRKKSAAVAKERLQIILAHEHAAASGPQYLPALQRELLAVVSKYAKVDLDDIKVTLEKEGDCDILELNITLPDVSQDTVREAVR